MEPGGLAETPDGGGSGGVHGHRRGIGLDFVVGQTVTPRWTIIQPACGDHPDLLMAEAGEPLVINEIDQKTFTPAYRKAFPILVAPVARPKLAFWCAADEIKPVGNP